MNDTIVSGTSNPISKFKIILWTALLAGTLDILSAIVNTYIQYSISPDRIFKFIASGVFGDDAFSSGAMMVAAGIIFHYLIALTWSAIFFFIYPKFNLSSKYKFLSGFLYGIIVWLIMNLIVIPLSNTPQYPFTFKGVLLGVLFLIFFIGIPISLSYHKYYSSNKNLNL